MSATLTAPTIAKSEREQHEEMLAEKDRKRVQWLIDHPERTAEVGMVVYWYLWADKGEHKPVPGIVTQVNEDGTRLTISVHNPDGQTHSVKPFVAHIDEEGIPDEVKKDSGGWEHAPWMLRLLKLLAVMDKKLAATPK